MKHKLLGLTVAALTIAGISTASAHTVLISSNPAKGAVIKVLPPKITLTFADPLLTLGKKIINKVAVVNPNNKIISTGRDLTKGVILTDPLSTTSPVAGIYKVSYRVSAQDGHIVTGSFTFTLRN